MVKAKIDKEIEKLMYFDGCTFGNPCKWCLEMKKKVKKLISKAVIEERGKKRIRELQTIALIGTVNGFVMAIRGWVSEDWQKKNIDRFITDFNTDAKKIL